MGPEERPRTALVVAHPGHELRVHGWLELTQPRVCVLTDGSGHTQHSRLASTTRVIAKAGSLPGPVYGAMTDRDLYAGILDFDHSRFTQIVDEIASMLLSQRIEYVAGDAAEGYNPGHDLCRYIINAAVQLANRTAPTMIANFDFMLTGPPNQCLETLRPQAIWVNLDDAGFGRKLSAARNYPELKTEVEAALNGDKINGKVALADKRVPELGDTSENDFRVECLRPVEASSALFDRAPSYETYGEKQVRAGHYERVLRYREHMLPLATALQSHVEKSS